MKIHHLNCGTMHPIASGRMVCHVLLLESERGLALVDTGFGVRDVEAPAQRIGPLTRVIRPEFDYHETALAQIEALGFERSDVTDVVMTHLDSDHAGGVDDFPSARLHVSARELADADSARGQSPAVRYRPWRQSTHPDDVHAYDATPDDWFGFAATSLVGFGDDVAFVALPGHTAGHMGVAVRRGEGGCCTAATPSITGTRCAADRSRCRCRSPSSRPRALPGWRARLGSGSPTCTNALPGPSRWSAHTMRRCTTNPRPPATRDDRATAHSAG